MGTEDDRAQREKLLLFELLIIGGRGMNHKMCVG